VRLPARAGHDAGDREVHRLVLPFRASLPLLQSDVVGTSELDLTASFLLNHKSIHLFGFLPLRRPCIAYMYIVIIKIFKLVVIYLSI
jgi:hypothetical protein